MFEWQPTAFSYVVIKTLRSSVPPFCSCFFVLSQYMSEMNSILTSIIVWVIESDTWNNNRPHWTWSYSSKIRPQTGRPILPAFHLRLSLREVCVPKRTLSSRHHRTTENISQQATDQRFFITPTQISNTAVRYFF